MVCVNPESHSSCLPCTHVLYTSTIFYSNTFSNLYSICTTYFYLHSKQTSQSLLIKNARESVVNPGIT